MLVIELPLDQQSTGHALEQAHPGQITMIEGSAIDGTMTHWSLAFSAAALALPEVRKVVIALLDAKHHRSFMYKGVKFQGYAAEEIQRILREITGKADV